MFDIIAYPTELVVKTGYWLNYGKHGTPVYLNNPGFQELLFYKPKISLINIHYCIDEMHEKLSAYLKPFRVSNDVFTIEELNKIKQISK